MLTFSGIRTNHDSRVRASTQATISAWQTLNLAYNGKRMPRFRPTAKLERSALADLWKHTLSHIPTVCGRLVYVATLRDVNSGTYKHHGLVASFGRDEAARALRESHEEAFREWLNLPLAEKNHDLKDYLVALDDPQEEVAEHWLRSGVYRSYVPAAAMEMEKELFSKDLEILLQFLRHDAVKRRSRHGGDAWDRDSSRLA